MQPPASEPSLAPRDRAPAPGAAWVLACLVLASLLPSFGTWGAPWIAEDAAILGYVHDHAPGADALGSQYGLSTVRFWRPLATLSWDLQELAGVDPAWLRALNLAAHVLTSVLVARIARQLGLGTAGALAAGLVAATFPAQGGTVTWLSGRTDGLVAPAMLLACTLALGGRRIPAAAATLLACATKEMAFLLPFWVAVLALATSGGSTPGGTTGRRWRATWRAVAPVLAACVAAFLLRRLLLGAWIGGYPRTPAAPLIDQLAGSARALGETVGSTWGPLLLLGILARGLAGASTARILVGPLLGLAGALPLLGLISDGVLEPQNLRTVRVLDLGAALLAAALVAPAVLPRRGGVAVRAVLGLAVATLVGARGVQAWRDTRAWASSADAAARWEASVRERLPRLRPGEAPVLVPGVPRNQEGAYHLGFGVADRFRAPFPVAPRPVWPWRTIFEGTQELEPARGPLEGFLVPEGPARAPQLEVLVRGTDGRPREEILLDESAAEDPDRSPRLEFSGVPPGSFLAGCVVTELGYQAFPVPGERTTLRALVLASDGAFTFGDAWYLAADMGAGTRAYLEFRAIDPADGRLLAASAWIPVVWEKGLMERLSDPYADLRR